MKIGEITPIENQATDIFPKISEILCSCTLDNLILDGIFLIYHKAEYAETFANLEKSLASFMLKEDIG